MKTVSACCCFDLKTGGLILGYLNLIWYFGQFFKAIRSLGLSPILFLILILVFISMCWIDGIEKNKPEWMLPELILSIIIMIMYFCVLISIPITMLAEIAYIIKGVEVIRETDLSIVVVVWIIIAILAVLQWYFTIVKYSLYKSMMEANASNASNPSDKPANIYEHEMISIPI